MTFLVPDPPSNGQENTGIWEKWKQEVSKLKAARSYKINFPTVATSGTYDLARIPTKYFATELTPTGTPPSLVRTEIMLGGQFDTSMEIEVRITGTPFAYIRSLGNHTTVGQNAWRLSMDLYSGRSVSGGVEANYLQKDLCCLQQSGVAPTIWAGSFISPFMFNPNDEFCTVQFKIISGTCYVQMGHIITHPAS